MLVVETIARIRRDHLVRGVALIEAIYRSVYVMVTLKREDLLDAERDEELDDLVAAARRTMTETMEEGSP